MRQTIDSINKRSGRELGMGLEYAWHGIGMWQA
jgi:hypothetical protein